MFAHIYAGTFLAALVLSPTDRQTDRQLLQCAQHTIPSTWVSGLHFMACHAISFHFVFCFCTFPSRLSWRYANFAMQQIVKRIMQRIRKSKYIIYKTKVRTRHVFDPLTRLHCTDTGRPVSRYALVCTAVHWVVKLRQGGGAVAQCSWHVSTAVQLYFN